MITGLAFAAALIAFYAVRWLYAAKSEGARRLRAALLIIFAVLGLWSMLVEFGWLSTALVFLACAAIRWIYRGFKANPKP
jgi:hypothetical protein